MANKNAKKPVVPGMELGDFTPQQNQALLDLLVLAMYLDGNLAQVEEARLKELLTAMGFETDYDRNRELDTAVTRVRRETQTPAAVKACVAKLAANFTTRLHQARVFDFLNELTALDGNVSSEESQFLSSIKETFRL